MVASQKQTKIGLAPSHMIITVEHKRIRIPVPPTVKAHFDEQFSRPTPSQAQNKKYKTVMQLMTLAYLAGRQSRPETTTPSAVLDRGGWVSSG